MAIPRSGPERFVGPPIRLPLVLTDLKLESDSLSELQESDAAAVCTENSNSDIFAMQAPEKCT